MSGEIGPGTEHDRVKRLGLVVGHFMLTRELAGHELTGSNLPASRIIGTQLVNVPLPIRRKLLEQTLGRNYSGEDLVAGRPDAPDTLPVHPIDMVLSLAARDDDAAEAPARQQAVLRLASRQNPHEPVHLPLAAGIFRPLDVLGRYEN